MMTTKEIINLLHNIFNIKFEQDVISNKYFTGHFSKKEIVSVCNTIKDDICFFDIYTTKNCYKKVINILKNNKYGFIIDPFLECHFVTFIPYNDLKNIDI